MGNKKISVVIPVYNGAQFIETAISSVVNQTYTNYEIIVVNDGSVDSTREIVDKIALKNEKIKLINKENAGVSVARNIGMRESTGEYLTFLDADDKLECTALELMLQCIVSYDADICVAKILPNVSDDYTCLYTYEECIKLCIEDNPLIYACHGKLYRTQSLKDKNIEFPVGVQAHEDSYFVFNCFYNGLSMAWLNHELYLYNTELTNSLSRSSFSEKRFSIIDLAEKKRTLIKQKFSQYDSIVDNILIKAHMAFLGCFDIPSKYKHKEKISLKYVSIHKKNFKPATRQDKRLFFIITHHFYGICKFIIKTKRTFKNNQ